MAATGNAAANAYWEAKLAAIQKPNYESSDLEPFIRRKYCNKEYAEGTWPPAAASNPSQTPAAPSQETATAVSTTPTAGRSEAGGFWGSLTPQESGTGRDWAPQGELVGTNASPALLIDLMDFGADSTFQLPTTPRRTTSSSAQQLFDSPADIHARGTSLGTAPVQAAASSAPSTSATGLAVPAVTRQRSNFLLPPPPQVGPRSALYLQRPVCYDRCLCYFL